jgi:hypothetical protein
MPALNEESVMQARTAEHAHTTDEERRIREAALDETLAGTFPASDPLSSNPNPDDHGAIERDAIEGKAVKGSASERNAPSL